MGTTYAKFKSRVSPAWNKCKISASLFILMISPIGVFADFVSHVVKIGFNAQAIGANTATNKIYAISMTGAVKVIDGVSYDTASKGLISGYAGGGMGVNSITNKIWVTAGGTISGGFVHYKYVDIIDGISNSTTMIMETNYGELALNQVTNKIYVVNDASMTGGSNDGNLTVIDGSINTFSILPIQVGYGPIAVNTVTNRIYCVNALGKVTVVDGATNTAIIVMDLEIAPATAVKAAGIAVNSTTNKIYVADYANNVIVVIDGATNTHTIINGNYKGSCTKLVIILTSFSKKFS